MEKIAKQSAKKAIIKEIAMAHLIVLDLLLGG
jgi:hypothetical protein